MSERFKKRFTFGAVSPNVAMIKDNGVPMDIGEVVDCLNEQHTTVKQLKEENEELDDENAKLLSERIRDLEIFEECVDKARKLKEENEQLRFELETHKHPLWSTREAERKVNKLVDSLADEVKKNGLLNEEINQLRIENVRLKKAEKINMEYAEQIVKEKNDLRIENDRLRQKIKKASDVLDEIF